MTERWDDVNEQVKADWKAETTPFERVYEIVEQTHDGQSAAEIADRALVSEPTARRHCKTLVNTGFAETEPDGQTTLYKRHSDRILISRIRELREEVDRPELLDSIKQMKAEIRRYEDRYDVISAEELAQQLDAEVPANVHIWSLLPLLRDGIDNHRDWALYGWWGQGVNITDGTYTYIRPPPEGTEVECYSAQMMDTTGWMTPPTSNDNAEAGEYLPYADTPVWRYAGPSLVDAEEPLLFDVESDLRQQTSLAGHGDPVEERLRSTLVDALAEMNAPVQQFQRLGLEVP